MLPLSPASRCVQVELRRTARAAAAAFEVAAEAKRRKAQDLAISAKTLVRCGLCHCCMLGAAHVVHAADASVNGSCAVVLLE